MVNEDKKTAQITTMPKTKIIESVQEVWPSFRSIRRTEARRKKAKAFRVRFSQSFASLLQRFSQAKVRSTTQRRGRISKPLALSDRLMISVLNCGRILTNAF